MDKEKDKVTAVCESLGDVEWAKQLASEIEERCVQVDYDYLGFDEDLCVKLLIAALRARAGEQP